MQPSLNVICVHPHKQSKSLKNPAQVSLYTHIQLDMFDPVFGTILMLIIVSPLYGGGCKNALLAQIPGAKSWIMTPGGKRHINAIRRQTDCEEPRNTQVVRCRSREPYLSHKSKCTWHGNFTRELHESPSDGAQLLRYTHSCQQIWL